MAELTLSEMLRLGGAPAYLSFFFGISIVVLIVIGYVAVGPYARRRPNGPLVKTWAWVIMLAGLVCAFNGGVGTIAGLANVHRAAAAGGAGAVMGEGAFEVLFNVAFGFMFAWLAVFGYATTRLVAAKDAKE
ncbi:MAG: hypothetical protein GTN49_04420 [candidate division Zixibacteria bacterium]|nr:hypothetical protein [candidate division Zixibacteria bacterium]